MERNKHTTDQSGFDYMGNSGREEKDRDTLGVILASLFIIVLTLFQYWDLY